MFRASLLFVLPLIACSAEPRPRGAPRARDAGAALDGSLEGDAGIPTDAGMIGEGPAGLVLFERLAGLWSGPATRTPLGDFSMMNVDFRPVGDQFMFGRVDVDEENALRFGFSVETHGEDVLTYRNGGYFLGLLRDDRTVLVEADEAAGTFRFCHVERGCEYIDAVYDFEGADRVVFDVMVRGTPHVYWDARRLETRSLAPGFVDGLTSQGMGDAPFPPMPDLRATVTWTSPLAEETPVWLVLSAEACTPAGCNISRQIRTLAPAGATSAEVTLAQVHGGEYRILAVVDRNRNLDRIFTPDTGDGVSLPSATVRIAPAGVTTTNVPIVIDL